MAKTIINDKPTIIRWQPDFRYREDKLKKVELGGFKSTEHSLTDKEAYRITLSSLRGELASGMGSPTTGSYSLKAGDEYNPDFDFSFLNRPDLSLVELHEYIEEKKMRLENYDAKLRSEIEKQLKAAEEKAKEMEKQEVLKTEKKSE